MSAPQHTDLAADETIGPEDEVSATVGEPEAADEAEVPPLRPGKILLSTLGILTLVMVGAGAVAYFFKEPLLATSQWFVEHLGGPGIAVGFVIPDATSLPLPSDAISSFGLIGGMSFAQVVTWGSLGSLVGGSLGWSIGRWLIGGRPRLQKYLERRGGDQVRKQLRRHGAVFLALAAITPLPYSVACWAAGAVRMPYHRFISISLIRIGRVALYLWLIERGFLSVIS
jgi:membrane protein YqaA with SNARE-associated domain